MLTTRLSIGLVALCLTNVTFAQTFSDYLKLRKRYGISQHSSVAALETMVGTRVLEVQGSVKGHVKSGDSATLILESTGGDDLFVEAQPAPDWLMGNEVPARLIIRAHRPHEAGDLRAVLVGAAPEHKVANHEEATRPKTPETIRPAPNRLSGPIGRPKATRNLQLPTSEVLPYYAAFIKKRNPRLSNEEAIRIAHAVIGFSIRYGVDARLVMAMVLVESGFNPNATSRKGAMGLGQLMPSTAKSMGVNNAYDSVDNLFGTVRLVRGHLEKYYNQTGGDGFESLVLALAAYNAGGGAVRRHGGVPPYRETQNYVKKVIATYRALSGQ
ncbi:MAG: Membrane-bound lytic murein transglycosylase F [Fimbriimonadaceae bacterium]|nr:Membrane-bound lytic murein transglycosylase F [Fimbriimonadaceae bacterium]